MLIAVLVFFVASALVVGCYVSISTLPGALKRRRLERRIREVGQPTGVESATVLMQHAEGPLPALDRMIRRTGVGGRLALLIEQAASRRSPTSLVITSLVLGAAAAAATHLIVRYPLALLVTVPLATAVPVLSLVHRRSARLHRFEEQFPEALELVSRALRAGHAFQTALGMVAEELDAPVGPEFKAIFDQQNFGLPLREALNTFAERVPLVDVKFFVTAVAIQRDTGGNLAEILDNLAYVVRERFKIRRQVRVHTAHGRITGFVLLGLPAFLAVALSVINPGHMKPMFEADMGQMMLLGTIVMQVVGFIWIRRVIRIEV